MGRSRESTRHSIRNEAERFLETSGFSTPPLPPDQALAARKLVVSQYSLDDLLHKANLPTADHNKIQAMLDADERTVAFNKNLHVKKKHWGSLHEVAHEFIPWQRDLLYCCPLLWLPPRLQSQFEIEADLFASEAFFFGSQFHKQAYAGEFGFSTAIALADEVYGTSLHATFKHYVAQSPLARCLLIWKPNGRNGSLGSPVELELRYYVKSKSFTGHIELGQMADPDEVVSKVFETPSIGVVEHEMIIQGRSGEMLVAKAESISNSYNVFTLISRPLRGPKHMAPAKTVNV